MPDNQTIKDRINLALERSGQSQRELARVMQKSSAAISEMLTKPAELDSISYIEATAKLTGFSFEWIRTGQGPEKAGAFLIDEPETYLHPHVTEAQEGYSVPAYLQGKHIRPITVTVDLSGKELITYVPVKAQAGYPKGYGDPKFVGKLPAFSLPVLISQTSTHRMFQVDGNSMRQLGGGGLNDGDIVIASYVEDIFSGVKDGRVYVVITTEGVLIKRVINRLQSTDKVLVLNSDNKSGEYGPIIVHPHEILEVWELKAFLSKQLSLGTDIWDMLNDLSAKQAILEDKVKDLLSEKKLTR